MPAATPLDLTAGPAMDPRLRSAAEAATGFMPADEGLALHAAAAAAAARRGADGRADAVLVEIGTWCGKSTLYLADAARGAGARVVTVDHHRGSEENQPGWEWHDPSLVDPAVGRIDTLPFLRRTLVDAGVEDVVTVVVGRSRDTARLLRGTAPAFVFVDGGHSEAEAQGDYEAWAPLLPVGGLLAVHDVFPDPADGGQPPWHVVQRALASGAFEQVGHVGSLRVLERVGPGA